MNPWQRFKLGMQFAVGKLAPEQQQQAQAQELAKRAAMMDVRETESKVVKNIADAQSKGMNSQSQAEAVNVSKMVAVTQATQETQTK